MAAAAVDERLALAMQCVMRGRRDRNIHVKRARAGAEIVCPLYVSSPSVVAEAVRLAEICESDSFVDLGSGDGSVLLSVAATTRASCVGIEIDAALCETTRRNAALQGLGNVRVEHADLSSSASILASATVVYMWLVPRCMPAISQLLRENCAAGTRVVIYKNALPVADGWEPAATAELPDVVSGGVATTSLYLYHVKLGG